MGLHEKIDENDSTTFASLGVCEPLCKTLAELKYKTPTNIQKEALPYALQGKDIIGLAETGSGKTAAFAIPVLQALLDNPSPYFCLVLAPTRELAIQINDSFKAIGSGIGVKTCVLVGGLEMMRQSIQLMSKPHIIIATPGRLVDHLQNTKGFNLKNLKYLVFDEADRMLGMEFENDINTILGAIPKERRTYLYSATMTDKVRKLERAALRDPVKVEVSQKYSTVDTLKQQYIFIPEKFKDCYLAFILNELAGRSVIIFTASCHTSLRLAVLLKALGFAALPLSGKMQQTKRLSSLNSFKSGATNVLVCTDVASRGLDIPSVDAVLNYDLPQHSKDYIHRVGRTARAGRSGQAITFVTQYDIEYLQRIEKLIKKKLELYPTEEEEVMVLRERVQQAQRYASMQIKETSMVGFKRSGAFDGNRDLDDDEDTLHDTIAQLSKSRKKRKAKAAAGGASNNKKARK